MLRPTRSATGYARHVLHLHRVLCACLAGLPLTAMLGACTHLSGEREAYMHARQIMVEMDVTPADEPVTRVASWPGPEHNLVLVRGDSAWPSELAQATPTGPQP